MIPLETEISVHTGGTPTPNPIGLSRITSLPSGSGCLKEAGRDQRKARHGRLIELLSHHSKNAEGNAEAAGVGRDAQEDRRDVNTPCLTPALTTLAHFAGDLPKSPRTLAPANASRRNKKIRNHQKADKKPLVSKNRSCKYAVPASKMPHAQRSPV